MTVELEQPYKYKELCKALSISPLKGGYQRTQLAQLSELYDIEKTADRKYIVHKIYDEIEQLENKRQLQYKSFLTPILYTLLVSTKDNVIKCSIRELMEILPFVNKDYNYAKWNMEKVENQLTNGDGGDLEYFFKVTEPMYKRMIRDILKDMDAQKLIQLNLVLTFAKKTKNDSGHMYTKTWNADHEKEIPIFLEAQRNVINMFGVTTWDEFNLLPYPQRLEGNNYIEKYLKDKLGIDYYYYQYEIILNKKGIESLVLSAPKQAEISFNKLIQLKTKNSKAETLLLIDEKHKESYIDALIDITNDYNLRENLK